MEWTGQVYADAPTVAGRRGVRVGRDASAQPGRKRDRHVDLGLKDKVALVGAASKGLGKASALALAREGARVTICARTEADLHAAAQEIRDETGAEGGALRSNV